ncbi:MAG TPA: AraC family transcriptional regulator [Tepidisphaeraceae bacterium]|nr:AraC family transcriptional regulator [Tepidisphaeraceae bacterium]
MPKPEIKPQGSYWVSIPQVAVPEMYPCAPTAMGRGRFAPGDPYPFRQHPLDYPYDWSAGRILQAFQIIYVTHGGGTFRSGEERKRQRVDGGSVLLLFPGVWHHYTPDIETGWTEHWIECQGAAFERALLLGTIRRERPVLRVGMNHDLLDAFNLCHRWAQRAVPSRASALAALALHLLAIVEAADESSGPPSEADRMIERAQAVIVERFHERLDMRELAASLGVGYSYLRQRFKARTGISLKRYHVQVRIQRAQDLLANTDKSVKEIADLLGFDSPYHFSAQFKSRTGLAPQLWRRRRPAPDGRV